jgi:hypothetical protein
MPAVSWVMKTIGQTTRRKGPQEWEQKYLIKLLHFKIIWIISKFAFKRKGAKVPAAIHRNHALLMREQVHISWSV